MGNTDLWRQWLFRTLKAVDSNKTEGYHALHIGLLEHYYEAINAVKLDVFRAHPFSCDHAFAVNDPIEGGMRAAFVDEYQIYQVREKLGFSLERWMALPNYKTRLYLKRIKLINDATAPQDPPQQPPPNKPKPKPKQQPKRPTKNRRA